MTGTSYDTKENLLMVGGLKKYKIAYMSILTGIPEMFLKGEYDFKNVVSDVLISSNKKSLVLVNSK